MSLKLSGVLALTLLAACTKPTTFRTEHAQIVALDELPQDFKIPAHIWTLVEKGDEGHGGGEKKEEGEKKKEEGEKKGGEGAAAGASAGTFYSAVKIFLTEKNPGILKTPAYEITLPRGGGTVDLAQYLSGDPGSFYLGFELPEEFQDGKNFKAIYLSKGRKRKIDDRVYGSGCNQYMDITPKFLELMKGEGIKANTTRQRHTTVLAGSYIFSVIKDNKIYITQVTITDSQNKNLLCEAL